VTSRREKHWMDVDLEQLMGGFQVIEIRSIEEKKV
jgi:hypothetical protein